MIAIKWIMKSNKRVDSTNKAGAKSLVWVRFPSCPLLVLARILVNGWAEAR